MTGANACTLWLQICPRCRECGLLPCRARTLQEIMLPTAGRGWKTRAFPGRSQSSRQLPNMRIAADDDGMRVATAG